jgi:hypothetical protein
VVRKNKKKDKEKWEGRETRDGLGSSVDTSGSSEDRVYKSVFYSDLALIPCLSTLQIKLQVSGRALLAHAHCENIEDRSQSPREYMGFGSKGLLKIGPGICFCSEHQNMQLPYSDFSRQAPHSKTKTKTCWCSACQCAITTTRCGACCFSPVAHPHLGVS